MQPIQAIGLPPIAPQWAPRNAPVGAASGAPSFKDVLVDSLKRASAAEMPASGAVADTASQAQTTFHTVMQVRDRLMAAYQEIKDMRI
jgi:flagellar hook-basal body complex protein FliE